MIISSLSWFACGAGVIASVALAGATATVRRRRAVSTEVIVASLPAGGPIVRLDFSQSFNPIEFAHAAEEEALCYVNLHLRDFIADGTTLTLQTLRQIVASGEMVVGASAKSVSAMAKGAAKLQKHGASGRRLPHVISSMGGKTQEVMREAGTTRKLIASSAAASTIIVSAAHLIATADLARTLRGCLETSPL